MESNKDNKDILSWKRVIENIQSKTEETVSEYNKAQQIAQEGQIGIEDQDAIETEHYNVVVSSNDHGIIVDVYDKHDPQKEPIKSDQYWDEDVMESKETVTEESEEDLINKVAMWIYHESDSPISEIEHLLRQSGEVGNYMDAVSENKEKVTEGTWSIPDTPEKVRELKDLMSKELPADEAQDKIYGILGDDELFDAIAEMEEKDPKADVRGMIVRRLDDLGLLKKKTNEEKQRLDPECWDGYKKDGTKMKNGTRVNNCVKK